MKPLRVVWFLGCLAAIGGLFGCQGEDSGAAVASRLTGGYALQIYGNANEDWYVDAADIAHLRGIIAGDEEETGFADANRDGVVDEGDIDKVQRIIDGTAESIWLLDGNRDPVLVDLPVNRIGVEYLSNAELMNVLGVSDRVVALDSAAHILRDIYFPGRDDLLTMGQMHANPAFEDIYEMELDVLFTFSPNVTSKQEKLPDTDVVFLGLYWPNVIEPENSQFLQGVLKAGYLLGVPERAYEYVDWLLELVETIGDRTASIPEDARPRVLMTSHNRYFQDGETMAAAIYTKIDPLTQACLLAGGRPVAEDIPEWLGEGGVYGTTVDMEWVITQDPEFIFAHSVRYTYSGLAREPSYGYDENDPTAFNEAVKAMKARPLLEGLQAVENDRIYITAGDFRNNAMGGILGAAYLARILYPEQFSNLDPQAIHQEFVSDWMGLEYDLGRNGVFIAPPLADSHGTR
jgi:iron complex transport system substrate-binding protein